MICCQLCLASFVLLVSVSIAGSADLDPELRNKVLSAANAMDAGRAYEAYFTKVGRSNLVELSKDSNLGIAFQASWEGHKQLVSRSPAISERTEFTYEPKGLKRFVTFLKSKTNVVPPEWWQAALTDLDVFPESHHASLRTFGLWPKLVMSQAGYDVIRGAALQKKGDTLQYTEMGKTVEFAVPTDNYLRPNTYTGVLGKERSVIAGFDSARASNYELICIESSGMVAWRTEVWVTGQMQFTGIDCHRATLIENDGIVYVFGASGHGAYLEAFEMATGKTRFRFSSAYWSNYSEGWNSREIEDR